MSPTTRKMLWGGGAAIVLGALEIAAEVVPYLKRESYYQHTYDGIPAPVWGGLFVIGGVVVLAMGVQRYRNGE